MNTYTSNQLCHFVGRSKETEEERFDLLKTIIRENKLKANLNSPDNPESYFLVGSQCEHVGEVFKKCDCVCFCDIPKAALSIHTNKYSKFGIGFKKSFIAAQGARPVMYVPLNYDIVERGDSSPKGRTCTPKNPKQYFSYLLKLAGNVQSLTICSLALSDLKSIEKWYIENDFGECLDIFDDNIRKSFFEGKYNPMFYSLIQGWANEMMYVKLYDSSLPDDHPDNYYMEREWRSIKNIDFTLNDIEIIFLPNEEYKCKFKQEFNQYQGEYFVLNS